MTSNPPLCPARSTKRAHWPRCRPKKEISRSNNAVDAIPRARVQTRRGNCLHRCKTPFPDGRRPNLRCNSDGRSWSSCWGVCGDIINIERSPLVGLEGVGQVLGPIIVHSRLDRAYMLYSKILFYRPSKQPSPYSVPYFSSRIIAKYSLVSLICSFCLSLSSSMKKS